MSQAISKRDPVDVLHADVLSSPGGISAAARLVGRSPGILHNKFSEATIMHLVSELEGMVREVPPRVAPVVSLASSSAK